MQFSLIFKTEKRFFLKPRYAIFEVALRTKLPVKVCLDYLHLIILHFSASEMDFVNSCLQKETRMPWPRWSRELHMQSAYELACSRLKLTQRKSAEAAATGKCTGFAPN